MKQTTLQKEIRCAGIGLHSGNPVELVLRPASADTGVIFSVPTASGRELIALRPDRVISTGLATTLGFNGAKLSTVEHLLAALVGLEVDNVRVDVEGDELPILDGSSAAYVDKIRAAGLCTLQKARTVARVVRPLHLAAGDKSVSARPYAGLKIDYSISFAHPKIGAQRYVFDSTPASFVALIARARTFGFLRDVQKLQENGLARGGSLANVVVFDDADVLNPEGLRFANEMVRHKILDFMGDIAVGSHRLQGHFQVVCSGHDLNNKFMRHLFAHADEYLDFTPLGPRRRRSVDREPLIRPLGAPAWA